MMTNCGGQHEWQSLLIQQIKELTLGQFYSLIQICVTLQRRGIRRGTAENLFLFVDSIDILGNQAFHDSTLRLQDL